MSLESVEIPFSGGSMNPFFKNTKSVWVDFTTPKKIEIGDVLLYRDSKNEWVCHRLIFLDKNGYWLKGDANTHFESIQDLRHWGRVRAICRGHRRVDLRNTIFTKWLCCLQKRQVISESLFSKKFYRAFVNAFLNLETLFSNWN